MRVLFALLPLLSLCDGKGGMGGGRGASGARGASAAGAARGASSGARGASSSAGRGSSSSGFGGSVPYAAAAAPRPVSTPVRRPSSGSIGAPLLGFGAGALAGAFTANRINNAYAPVSYGGNNYYWGRDVVPQNEALVCTRPLDDINEVNFDDIMFQDGTRPVEFAWSCSSTEQCCDWKCCPDDGGSIAGWIILGIALAALLLFAICIGCYAVKRRKKRQLQQSRQNRVVASTLNREDAWSHELPASHHTPPVFTSPNVNGVPPAYSNVIQAAPMPKSTMPDKPPPYA